MLIRVIFVLTRRITTILFSGFLQCQALFKRFQHLTTGKLHVYIHICISSDVIVLLKKHDSIGYSILQNGDKLKENTWFKMHHLSVSRLLDRICKYSIAYKVTGI